MTSDSEQMIQDVISETKWYMVMKPFKGETAKYVSGEIVDASTWKHTKSLRDSRYIAPVPKGVPIPEIEVYTDGVERRIYRSAREIDALKSSGRPTPTRNK